MKTKKILSFAIVLALLVGTLTGCSGTTQSSDSTGTTESGSTSSGRDDVIVRVEQVFYNLNPYVGSVGYPNLYVMDQTYEPLTRVDDNSKINPLLATDWTVSDDASVYTFNIRKDVKFHNGETLKASDVVFSYKTAMESPAMHGYVGNVESVEALDDYTVKIKLSKPSVSFLSFTSEVYIVNEKFYKEVEGNLMEQMCGTGPYKQVAVDLTTEIELEAFADYWGGEASIKHVYMRPVTDATTAVVSFETGEIDYMQVNNISAFGPLADSKKYNTELVTTLHTAYIAMNNKVPPFDNKLVRQALMYAMDTETMIQVAYEGYAEPARMMADERCVGVDFSNSTKYTYDLEKAKALLAEAGYPNGIDFEKDFGVKMDIIAGGYFEKIAQIFQESLNQIGCKLNLRASETYSSDAATGKYSIITQGMTFTADFGYLSMLYGTVGINSKNHARFSNARVDELFKLADSELDPAVRNAYYKEICEIVTDECPTLVCFHRKIPYAWSKDLKAVPHAAAPHPYYIYEWSWN